MSFNAFRYVSSLTALSPNHKLVMFQLASFHNDDTGQCNPSPQKLAEFTGMTPQQVRTLVHDLAHRNLIRFEGRNIEFAGLEDVANGQPLPEGWRPSERAMEHLRREFPDHQFDMEDAINDFAAYARRTGRRFADFDDAFCRSIAAILRRREPGQVQIGGGGAGEAPHSVRSVLSGRA